MKNDEIEQMIDECGTLNVLRAFMQQVTEICNEKADHLRSNWQDEATAEQWEKTARRIERVMGMRTFADIGESSPI